jgi:hypothetical protein
MMLRMKMMRVCKVSMVRCGFMVAIFMMRSGLMVMLRGMFVMRGGFLMMFLCGVV